MFFNISYNWLVQCGRRSLSDAGGETEGDVFACIQCGGMGGYLCGAPRYSISSCFLSNITGKHTSSVVCMFVFLHICLYVLLDCLISHKS